MNDEAAARYAERWRTYAKWSLGEITTDDYIAWLRASPDYCEEDEFAIAFLKGFAKAESE